MTLAMSITLSITLLIIDILTASTTLYKKQATLYSGENIINDVKSNGKSLK